MESEGSAQSISSQNVQNSFPKPTVVASVKKNKNRKKKRKNKAKKKNQQLGVKKSSSKRKAAMNSIVENFNNAATWQYKHQIAYWRAKAKALEYENRVLHDIIRKSHVAGSSTTSLCSENIRSDTSSSVSSECDSDTEIINGHVEDQDPDMEVTEAFINFLTENAKYKEEARLERERLRAKERVETEEDCVKRMEQPPAPSTEDRGKHLEELYGSEWKHISALETSLQCQFMLECDKNKPEYWPNIPFNFNFS